jgi:TonB-linked SusC/RagA family outer membrane protein
MRNFTKHLKLVFLSTLLLASGSLFAQQTSIRGTVVDGETGNPLAGASIVVSGTSRAAVSDSNGGYTLSAAPNEAIVIQLLGYETLNMPASTLAANPIVTMNPGSEIIDEVVVVGYGVQRRATVTGAVSAVRGGEIVTTKNENTVNMLTGKVAGLRVVQNSSEPGQFKSTMDIRGFGTPTVVIDGVLRDNIARLDPEDIESISVLKDASAAIYGLKGGNGVILVTTKKGAKGTSQISYSGTMTWQRPSNFPEMVDAADWMTLYNERDMHSSALATPAVRYSDEEIASWRNGTNVSTNWRREVFRNVAPQTQHTINATGGNELVTYYASIGYQNQESFLQTDAINYEKYSLRSNVSANISKNLKFDLNISGFIDERNQTPHGSWDIVRAMWIMRPMDKVWYDQSRGMYMEPDNNTILNPVAAMNSEVAGENSYKSKWFQSSATLTWTLPWVPGLSLKGFYSYDAIINDNKEFLSSYTLYDPNYETIGMSTTWNMRENKPYQVGRFNYIKNHSLWNASLNYSRRFGKHNVGAMALLESTYKEGDNFRARRQIELPVSELFAGTPDDQYGWQDNARSALYEYSYNSLVGRVTYDYANKYMFEATVRHEASSRFYKEWKWQTFPAVLAAYRISEEGFWRNSPLRFINNFKIRASYAVLGDDDVMGYEWMTGYTYPSGGNLFYNGTSPQYVTGSIDKGIANLNLTWLKNTTSNIGFDMEAWNGLLGVSFDLFQRKTEGHFAKRVGTWPGIIGMGLPDENLNSTRNRGFEIEVSHRNRVGEFAYEVRGNFAFTRERQLYNEQAPEGNSYNNWRSNKNNRNTGLWWGYGDAGRITSWDEIYYNPVFIGNGTVMGDYEYEDWNGDGMISELDFHPIAHNAVVPLINYGLSFSGSWRGIDLSMLWQGTSSRYTAYSEILQSPLMWGSAGTLSQFMDRWHPVDPKANPYDPATQWVEGDFAYTGTTANYNSPFNIQNAAYLRLKSLEIGYTFPDKWMKTVGIKSIRVYANAYNLLTITKLKYLDPEFPITPSGLSGRTADYGYNYPLNKTFSLGLNIKF